MEYENPQPYALALDVTAPTAYPLASAALLGVLVEMGFTPKAGPLSNAGEWAAHYTARMRWVASTVESYSHNETPAPAPSASAMLECWLAQNPAAHIAQWVEAVADALRAGESQITGIDAPADVCAVFDDSFLLYIGEEWDDDDLITL